MKVAVVHDWLTTFTGAERILEQILSLFPEADLFCVADFLPEPDRGFLAGRRITTSFIQHLPFARKKYRQYLPLMPLAVEQLDLTGYDLVLSNSHAVAKGVITGPDQVHVSNVCTPIRYAWDLQHQYLKETGLDRGLLGWIAKYFLGRVRMWDIRTANGVDEFIAISRYIARRIWKAYRRESTVIYPPVEVDRFTMCERKDAYFLTASRMVPYKKMDLVVEAFAVMPARRLVVIGDGPDFEKVKSKAGPNVELLGYQPTEVLKEHMQKACAFVFAAEEDFGIVPIEAQACGTPVIAFGRGAARETIRGLDDPRPTGAFFDRQSVESIVAAVEAFENKSGEIEPTACRTNALRFEPARFREEYSSLVGRAVGEFRKVSGSGIV